MRKSYNDMYTNETVIQINSVKFSFGVSVLYIDGNMTQIVRERAV